MTEEEEDRENGRLCDFWFDMLATVSIAQYFGLLDRETAEQWY